MKLILIGNSEEYKFSMKMYPELLYDRFTAMGLDVTLLRPRAVFSKLGRLFPRLSKWLFYLDKYLLFPVLLRRAVTQAKTHPELIVHVCDHSNSPYVFLLRDVRHVVTCHDLIAVRSGLGEIPQHKTRWTGKLLQRVILAGLRRAKHIVCISEATRRDVRRLVGLSESQMDLIYNGLHYPYSPMARGEAGPAVKKLTGLSGPYILHVGGNSWYKNRLGVLKIYARLRRDGPTAAGPIPHLVMTGDPLKPEMRAFIDATPEIQPFVSLVEGAGNEDLRALYSAAEMLLFPSIEEGFGWPIAEANACGCRVLTTNKAPMTEVGSSAAAYMDISDLDGSAQIVRTLLAQDHVQREEMISRGLENAGRFSPEAMIDGYLGAYGRLLANQP